MKITLICIDYQNDFVKKNGSLTVNGAIEDVQRLINFLKNNFDKIHEIVLSADSHPVIHISHDNFWENEFGKKPEIFTQISLKEYSLGKWKVKNQKYEHQTKAFLEFLSDSKQEINIWPLHCLAGTGGSLIVPSLLNKIIEWSENKQKNFHLIRKGENITIEQYSAFTQTIIPKKGPCFQVFDNQIFNLLNESELVVICGEAKDVCLSNCIADLNHFHPELLPKVHLLDDCCSPIDPCSKFMHETLNKAFDLGAKVIDSNTIF